MPNVRFIGPGASLLPAAVVVRQFSGVRCVCTEGGRGEKALGVTGSTMGRSLRLPNFACSSGTNGTRSYTRSISKIQAFFSTAVIGSPSYKPTRLRLRCELEGQRAASEIGIGQQSNETPAAHPPHRPIDGAAQSVRRHDAWALFTAFRLRTIKPGKSARNEAGRNLPVARFVMNYFNH